jgi:hypothetical protein
MQLTTDDRQAGLDAPDGRSFRPDGQGVITLPEELADYGRQAARRTPLFQVHRPQFAGFDAGDVRAAYAAWASRRREGSDATRAGR